MSFGIGTSALLIPKKADEFDNLGCDHDLETNQWLLYEEGINGQPSKVIQRFRY